MIIKIAYFKIKSYYNDSKYLKVKHIMYILKKSIRLHKVVMMMKQTFDRITTRPYGTNAFKLCESEMLSQYK